MENQFSRTESLIGAENLTVLQNSHIAIFGLGGVGGYAAEALARSGVGLLDIIDYDKISLSNINRQIIATHKTLGEYKTDVMKKRLSDINPEIKINTHTLLYLPEISDTFDFSKYDYIIDAVDNITAKINLVIKADENNVPIISCMGTGNKLDPTKFEVSDIYKTSVCPLAKVMRYELKKRNIKKLKVVYSKELPIKTSSRTPSSMIFCPATAGMVLANEVVRDLIKL